jgi:hypothetical protein
MIKFGRSFSDSGGRRCSGVSRLFLSSRKDMGNRIRATLFSAMGNGNWELGWVFPRRYDGG